MRSSGAVEKQTRDEGKCIGHTGVSETRREEGERFCNTVSASYTACLCILSAVLVTRERDLLGAAATVYRMWSKTLMPLLTLFPHSCLRTLSSG